MKAFGKVHKYGDNVDTDVIIPARYLNSADPKELATHCMEDIDRDFVKKVCVGDIMVAGKNFGCGSSREHAPISLINMGATLVLADSFARIFFRNAINLGLPLIVCKGISKHVHTGQTIRVDVMQGRVLILETGETLECEPFSEQTVRILEAGGIKPLMRAMDC